MALFLARLKNVTSVVGSTATGLRAAQKRVFLGGTALIIGLLASSGAWAQCVDSTPLFAGPPPPPVGTSFKDFLPFSQGGSVNSLISVIDTANTAFLSGTTAFVGSPPSPRPNQQGGGVWARAIGGTVENENTGVTSVVALGVPIPGQITCQTTTKQDFLGFQVGRDLAQLNIDNSGGNLHFGLTTGYFEAKSKDVTPGGTFHGDFQVPFAGLYASGATGNLFADGQVRWDFFDNRISDVANGAFDQEFGARSTSVTGNIGYRFDLPTQDGSKWFIEPSVGGVWSHTDVDPLNVTGTFLLGTGVAAPGTVQINDVESRLGRASVRVGTTFVSHKVSWQPFATASVFHEFSGDVTSTQEAFGIPGIVDSTLTTTRVGTYGQFGLGLAGQIIDTGWLGYARVDYRTGDNIEGVSGNIGLRYQLSPDPVAKGSLKDGPPPILSQVYNWTGFYVGGFAGMARGQEDWIFLPPADPGQTVEPRFGGYLLGGQAGYNYQMGFWVVGIEGDIGTSNAEGGSSCPIGFLFTCETEVDDLASVTGRLGYAWERALIYAKGGLAIGEVTATTSFNPGSRPSLIPLAPGVSPVNSSTETRLGWTVGTGVELALSQTWSAKGEWVYFDLGSDTYSVFPGLPVDADTRGNIARVGLNYHFAH